MTFDLHKPIFLALYLLLLLIYYFLFFRKSENKNFSKFLFISMFIFYILCLIKLTILPMRVTPIEEMNFDFSYYYQIVPFKTITQVIKYNTWNVQLLGNILLLLPLPIFIGFIKKKASFVNLFFIGFITSISIECIQLFIDILTKFPNKLADIDDIILNSVGSLIGAIIITIFNNYNEKRLENKKVEK